MKNTALRQSFCLRGGTETKEKDRTGPESKKGLQTCLCLTGCGHLSSLLGQSGLQAFVTLEVEYRRPFRQDKKRQEEGIPSLKERF